MAKRFIDTDLFKRKFFRSLEGPYKLFFIYMFLDCNHAGIWIVDFEMVNFCLKDINEKEAYNLLKDKVVVFDHGEKWFLPSFIDFQYGELNPTNRVHLSVINILRKNNLYDNKGLIRSLEGPKEKDKDKDRNKDKDKESFEIFWDKYHTITGNGKSDKEPAFKYWKKLSLLERDSAINKIQPYFDSLPIYHGRKPVKKARTYLGDKNFNDEFKPVQQQQSNWGKYG